MELYAVFVSCSKGMEYLLQDELLLLGVKSDRVSPQGVYATVTQALLYKICLWSRIAGRVHLILCSGKAGSRDALYRLCLDYPWDTVCAVKSSFLVSFHGENDAFRHTIFGAQVVKDAIVDYFSALCNQRPRVDKEAPDIRIHVHLKQDTAVISLDMTGYSLHQRGYRWVAGIAPLKEHIAAGLLYRSQWPSRCLAQQAFHDPFCGSGTLVIEAAMMAAQKAPGLFRQDQSFHHWLAHDSVLWTQLCDDATALIKPPTVSLLGTDEDEQMIERAWSNAKRAGVEQWVDFQVKKIHSIMPAAPKGLVVTNPPYGLRLGQEDDCQRVYQSLGQVLSARYKGWDAFILTAKDALAKAIGLRSHKQYQVLNGAVQCRLYAFHLTEDNHFTSKTLTAHAPISVSPAAQMLNNRLEKNLQHLKRWAQREHILAYRLYDADLPEYAFAIDRYGDYVVLQEYAPPSHIPEAIAAQRRQDMINVLSRVLDIPLPHIILKQRKVQKGLQQYEKEEKKQQTVMVNEGCARFLINLTDYLDTGLFLDHRLLRLRFAALKKGTRFLNCFCYTATASVHAALAGAKTVNIDLSKTYLEWAQENFRLNQLDITRHEFIQADCRTWLQQANACFDVIFLDPPSFSNSKKMKGILDIQRDHVDLIELAMNRLVSGGVLYFSTNLRSFLMDSVILERYNVQNITKSTIDIDFKRNHKIHHCFKIGEKYETHSYD